MFSCRPVLNENPSHYDLHLWLLVNILCTLSKVKTDCFYFAVLDNFLNNVQIFCLCRFCHGLLLKYFWCLIKFLLSVFPLEPHKVNPSSMQETHRPLSKHYHLQNAHNQGFELGLTSTNDPRALNDRFTKKQHFVRGKVCWC